MFLSVSPSLDLIGVGADVDAGVDVGADADRHGAKSWRQFRPKGQF